MPPSSASDSGKPSAEAARFLDQTTGADKPRVFRNAVLPPFPPGADADGVDVDITVTWHIIRH
jgi:hypothetical protein